MRVSFPLLLAVVAATAVLSSTAPRPADAAAAPAAAAAAPAKARAGFAGIEAMTATVFQKDQSSFAGLAIRARLKSARLLENVDFLPTVEYWRNSSKVDAFDLRTVRRDATLGVDSRWMFPGEAWRFYAGAGYAVHFLSSEVDAPTLGLNNKKDSLTKGGVALLAGATFGASTASLGSFVEVKWHLVGDFEQVKINLGLSWNR